MKRSRATIKSILAIVVALSAILGAAASASPPASSHGRIEKPFLFEVRKGESVSWLFGTIHYGVPYSAVSASIEPRLRAARATYFEIGDVEYIKKSESNRVDTMLISDFDFDEGTALSAAIRYRLTSEFRIPEKIVNAMHTGSCRAFEFALNLNEPDLDAGILLRANALQKPILGLDVGTLRLEADNAKHEQAAAADPTQIREPECDLERDFLMRSTAASLRTVFKKAFEEYRSGKDYSWRPENESVNFRNRAWIKLLTPEFEKGGIFVTVGVGHLYGHESLVELLKSNGYTVTRVHDTSQKPNP